MGLLISYDVLFHTDHEDVAFLPWTPHTHIPVITLNNENIKNIECLKKKIIFRETTTERQSLVDPTLDRNKR